jgi:hypothetical protein
VTDPTNQGTRKVARKFTELPDGLSFRLGTITAYADNPRRVTATIAGVSIANIPLLDSAAGLVGANVWVISAGGGQLLAIGHSNGLGAAAGGVFPRIFITNVSGDIMNVGNDSKLVDVGIANTMGVQGMQDAAQGYIKFGTAGPTIGGDGTGSLILPQTGTLVLPPILRLGGGFGPSIETNGDYLLLNSDTDIYLDGNSIALRDQAGANERGYINNDGIRIHGNRDIYWTAYGNRIWAQDVTWMRIAPNLYCGGEIQSGSQFRFGGTGYKFTHDTDTDTGFYYDSDGSFRLIGNGQTALWVNGAIATIGAAYGAELRLYSAGDSNHFLRYDGNTPTGSGEASNGPRLNGYSTVWLHQQLNDKSFFLSSAGNVFINGGNTYQNFSSRDIKENIETLDPADALAEVLLWRPVTFDYKEWPHRHADGFILEEHIGVSPQMCDAEMKSIAYAEGVPRLAAAIHALHKEIEDLKAEIAELRSSGGS